VESREERIAENEALFRAMNERMAEWQERRDAPPTDKHLFFCECGNSVCHERVRLSIPEYVAVRESPVRFAVLPGHVFPEVESVIDEREGYVVVEKHERFRSVIARAEIRYRDARSDGRAA
jgi:hypothetical protein